MRAKPGFTLIEILIVMLIIGITISFALLAFGDFGAKRQARLTAEQFVQYVQLLQQKATLQKQLVGLSVKPHQYQAMQFRQNQWQTIKHSNLYGPQRIPQKIQMQLVGQNNSIILIHTSGEVSPFIVKLSIREQPAMTIKSNEDGTLSIND